MTSEHIAFELARVASAMEKLAKEAEDQLYIVIGTPSTGGEVKVPIDVTKSLDENVVIMDKVFLLREEAIKKFKEQSTTYGFEKKPKETKEL